MSTPQGKPDVVGRAPQTDVRATIKLLRQQLQAHAEVPRFAQDGSLMERRAPPPIPDPVPEPLQRLLQAYRQRHPGFELETICYLAFGSSDARGDGLALQDLPDEEDLVVLSCTESAADMTQIHTQTQSLLLRRRKKE